MVYIQAQYLIVLCTFKEQLQQHVRVHAVEAVMACREIENTLQALTGLSPDPLSLPPLIFATICYFIFSYNILTFYLIIYGMVCISFIIFVLFLYFVCEAYAIF